MALFIPASAFWFIQPDDFSNWQQQERKKKGKKKPIGNERWDDGFIFFFSYYWTERVLSYIWGTNNWRIPFFFFVFLLTFCKYSTQSRLVWKIKWKTKFLCKTYFKKDAAHQRRIIIMSFHHRVYFFKYNLVPLGVYFEWRSRWTGEYKECSSVSQ